VIFGIVFSMKGYDQAIQCDLFILHFYSVNNIIYNIMSYGTPQCNKVNTY